MIEYLRNLLIGQYPSIVVHVFMSPAVFLISFVLSDWLQRHKVIPVLAGWWAFIVPALASFLVISSRETWDVYQGGLFAKSVLDWASWMTGLGLTVWGIYRHSYSFRKVVIQIEQARDQKRRTN